MSRKPYRSSRKSTLNNLCGQPGEDDGVDPRDVSRSSLEERGRNDRKTRQLCHQVACVIQSVLSEIDDSEISGLFVQSVVALSQRGCLLVTVTPGPIEPACSPDMVIAKLRLSARRFRAEVSAAITRRKTPELMFVYVPAVPANESPRPNFEEN